VTVFFENEDAIEIYLKFECSSRDFRGYFWNLYAEIRLFQPFNSVGD